MSEFTMSKDQRNIVNGTAKEYSRLVLNCVHIKPGIAEVADGFILVQKYIDYNGPEMLLNGKDIAAVKDQSRYFSSQFIDDENNGHVQVIGEQTLTISKAIGTFPNTEQLYPKDQPVFHIAIGKSILQKICKTMNKDSEMIKFYFTSPSNPVGFKVENDCQGLIMPMFAGPEFQNEKLEPFKVAEPETEETEETEQTAEQIEDHADNEEMQQYVNECIAEAESLTNIAQIAEPEEAIAY